MIDEIKLILKAQKIYYTHICGNIDSKKRAYYQKKINNIIEMFTNSNEHGIAILLKNYHFRDAIFLLKSHNDSEYEYLYKLQA